MKFPLPTRLDKDKRWENDLIQLGLNAPACSLRKVEKEIDLILGSANMGLERLVT